MSDTRRTTRENRYVESRFARVRRVDNENLLVDVNYEQKNGGQAEVQIGFPFATPRAVLGGIPEIGTSVLCDYTASTPHSSNAFVSSYIPSGFKSGVHLKKQIDGRNDLEEIGIETTRFRRKFRKMWPGEIIGSSTQGSDFILDEQTMLMDPKGDEIRIDSRDQSINQISMHNYKITDAARHSEGWVYRYIEELYDESGKVYSPEGDTSSYAPDSRQPFMFDESSKKRWYRTVRGDKTVDDYLLGRDTVNVDLNAAPLVEVRNEVREIGSVHLPMSDQNVETDIWGTETVDSLTDTEKIAINADPNVNLEDIATQLTRGNIIESVSGTLVGYKHTTESEKNLYGKVLRPQIFFSETSSGFDVKEVSVEENKAPDFTPIRYQAAAYMWKMPFDYAQTRLYVSKEGHTHLHVGSTWQEQDCPFEPQVEHPLGAGRSVEANFGGSIKAVIDKNLKREESIDLKTIGKVYFHFGKDDGIASNVRRTTLVDNAGNYNGGITDPVLKVVDGETPTATHTSIEGTTDGGIVLRVGRNHERNLRDYELNGFTSRGDHSLSDQADVGDVRDVERRKYGGDPDGKFTAGDELFQFGKPKFGGKHKLRMIGYGAPGRLGETEEEKRDNAGPVTNPDIMATSLDAHLVGNAFLRVGDNSDGNSLIMETKGAIAAWVGAEKKDNRSLIMTMDGGIEANIGRISGSGNSIQAYLQGGVDLRVRGNNAGQDFNVRAEGDQEYQFIGNQTITYEGTIDTTATVDMIRQVGSNYSLSINKNYYSQITGNRAITISKEGLDSVADKLVITKGNQEKIIDTQGDFFQETKNGKISLITHLGDEEFKAYIGKIVLEAMRGEILLQTPLTKVGPAPMLKFPVVTAATGCVLTGGFLPHTFGSSYMKVADLLPPPPFTGVPVPPIPEI